MIRLIRVWEFGLKMDRDVTSESFKKSHVETKSTEKWLKRFQSPHTEFGSFGVGNQTNRSHMLSELTPSENAECM